MRRARLRRLTAAAGLSLAALAVAGCAGMSDPTGLLGGSSGSSPAAAPPPAGGLPPRGAETGPAASTAVVESSFTMDGVVLPVMRVQSRSETRADMKRTDSAVTFDNWLLKRVAGDGRSAEIVRLDRQLRYDLDLAKQQYTECPLTGCTSGRKDDDAKPSRPEEPSKPSEPTCPVTLRANDVKVDATGERRTVNGFATERFLVNWALDFEDGSGGRNSNLVRLDLWTTPETGAVREVQAIDEQFARRHAAALTAGDGPLGRYLPKNVTGAMSLLTNRIDPKDKRTLDRWAAEMRKVRGYPIMTTMSWTSQGQVCGGSGGPPASGAAGMASIGSMLGGVFGGRGQTGAGGNAPAAPLISFTSEVKSLAVTPVANSVFAPPPEFKRSN